MRFIKFIFLSLIFVFVVMFGISLLLPSHVRVSRATDLQVSPERALAPIRDTTQWRHWYPGYDSMNTLQSGSRILMESIAADSVLVKFDRGGRTPVTSVWRIIRHDNTQSCTLQWYIDVHLRWYPWEKFSSIFLEKAYGSRMELGLQALTAYLQAKSAG